MNGQDYTKPSLLMRCKHCGKVYQMTALRHISDDEDFLWECAKSVSEAARNGDRMEVCYGDRNPEWCQCKKPKNS